MVLPTAPTPSPAVTWSFSPTVGTLSNTGLYTAPASVFQNFTITITATSFQDPTKFGTATTLTVDSSPVRQVFVRFVVNGLPGAGIERVAWVLQNVRSVYETDQLRGIMRRAEEITGRTYDPDGDPEGARALRAITEHARAGAALTVTTTTSANGVTTARESLEPADVPHRGGDRPAAGGTCGRTYGPSRNENTDTRRHCRVDEKYYPGT